MIVKKYKSKNFMPMLHKQLAFAFTLILIMGSCTKEKEKITPETIALVNGVPITKQEFVKRLELTPLPEIHKRGGRNERALNLLINELVVSQWAKEQGLDDSSDYKEMLGFVKEQALIRELFFDEIRTQAEPDSQHIRQALEKAVQQLTVRTLFTKDEKVAGEWREALQSGQTIDEIIHKSKDNPFVRLDSLSFHWGDGTVPIDIEEIAYGLDTGKPSGLIKLNNGYGIITVVHKIQNIILTPYELSTKSEQVKQVLRARNETRLAQEYIDRLLTPLKITQKAAGFMAVIRYLEEKMAADQESPFRLPVTRNQEYQSPDLDMPVLVTPDFTWTGKDVLNILRKYNFPINTENSKALQKSLTRFLKVAVRDHYLSRQADQLGLGSKKRVVEDVQMWGRYFLFMKGIYAFTAGDSTAKNIDTITNRIAELRANAQITINNDLLENIELTGIPMVVFWNNDISRQLAAPPLIEF